MRPRIFTQAAVAAAAPDAAIIRTSLLYGTADPSPFQIDLAHGLRTGLSPMTFFSDEFRCPVHADDLAAAEVGDAAQRAAARDYWLRRLEGARERWMAGRRGGVGVRWHYSLTFVRP